MSWLLLLWSCAQPDRTVPEVLIITVDTLRADRLGFAGHAGADTPTLDRLASTGRVFAQATTPLPRTTPALASMLTGLVPYRHGSREVGAPVQQGTWLAQILSEAGWRTAAFSAMPVAGPDQGFGVGFDRFDVLPLARADAIVEAAGSIVADQPARPLLLWVHLADPHFPYDPAVPGLEDRPCTRLGKRQRGRVFGNQGGRAAAALADCQALYDLEIAAVDRAIQHLLERWRAARGTGGWVVFTADHGENQGEGGLFYEHGPNVHDASLEVPLVVAGPGVEPGVDEGVAALQDLMPTVAALAGVPVPTDLDGVDLGARLAGAESPSESLRFAESGSALHVALFGALVSGRARRHCVNGERFSLCRSPGKERLVDHLTDPEMAHDLASSHPELLHTMRQAAERWPPETARQRTVRDARFKMVATPRLEGGYAHALYARADDLEQNDVSAAYPADAARLRAALDAWEAPTPQPRDRAGEEVDVLRALGYLE